MSIEQRLRNGLSDNTQHLQPYLERELDVVVQRARSRRRVRTAGFGLAAVAAVAAVAFWLPGVAGSIRADDDDGTAARPTPSAEASDKVRVVDSERGSPESPAPLGAGPYAIPFFGAEDALWGRVEVPTGWGQDRLHLATGGDLDPHLRRVELMAVDRVAPDLCQGFLQPVAGTENDIVNALIEQRGVRHWTGPRPVSIDGYQGVVLGFKVPMRLDEECGQSLMLFGFGPSWTSVFPGWTYRVWVLDVEGDARVILAAQGPKATLTEQNELTNMVEGMRFIKPR